ncbi:MAG: DNA-directed RNA polymerase subunit beta' [Peptococcaceae bacterium]|nr:DNA-directed RNA polymerase subunit beta' [Peptococcaceae bacterium]
MLDVNEFDSISISLASPNQIREWSKGEVKKPETINYRTLKPEREGLFCEKIFGPTKDWECNCGKYKRVRYKGIICDRCGVEVTRSKVRRERMGHIELAAPVSHIWYFKGIPSRMGLILDMSPRLLEKVLYFASYVVLEKGETALSDQQILTESEYRESRERYGNSFRAGMGAEAIRELLTSIDLEAMSRELRAELLEATGQRRIRAIRRLEVTEAFRKSGNRPEWMIFDVVPVIPPDLRPMVQLDGGRFATCDLNDLYRRVINRNNRLKRLLELGAPDIIVRNEKRMLQEAVDALIDNGRRGRPVTGPGNRPLKSLSDMLKGKQGRFRQNLLGKRVDYSGRSVIVAGPELKLYECGLPKEMALELFKPFVMKQLVAEGFAQNIKSAKRKVERVSEEVWDVLEEVIEDHPVLLNRAPTLHRLGIQAFEPVLVEGRAIKLHPLVCAAYNADFDGDQMAVHVPLSAEAQAEARLLLLSSNNLLNPKDGKPVVTPTKDMVLGCYYLTSLDPDAKGAGKVFAGDEEALMAYQEGVIAINAPIKVRRKLQALDGTAVRLRIDATIGRIMFNEAIPQDLGFVDRRDPNRACDLEMSDLVTLKVMRNIVDRCYRKHGNAVTTDVLDKIKVLGFEYATKSGISIAISDVVIPPQKKEIVLQAEEQVAKIERAFNRGIMSADEKYQSVIAIWSETSGKVQKALLEAMPTFNPMFMMVDSGARGNMSQITQLGGMRGLMSDPLGRIIELPVKSNFREGLTVIEYFTSTHGARKGSADTAIRTADSGYLTRRLVDVAQDVIVREADCGTTMGIVVDAIKDGKQTIVNLADRIIGRMAVADVEAVPHRHPVTGTFVAEPPIIVREGELIDDDDAAEIVSYGVAVAVQAGTVATIDDDTLSITAKDGTQYTVFRSTPEQRVLVQRGEAVRAGQALTEGLIKQVHIRSVLTCKSRYGICIKCYGRNLATGGMVEIGEAIGIIAAQSIGEPGTQLTMRTFHTGGVAGTDDITQGLPRVEELFEARRPKGQAIISEIDGTVRFVETKKSREIEIRGLEGEIKSYPIPYGSRLRVQEGAWVESGYELTDGPINPSDLLAIKGMRAVQGYILKEVQKVYRTQGVEINDKHVEVIVRQILRKVKIEDSGDTLLLPGGLIDVFDFEEANTRILMEGGDPAVARPVLLGITKASLATDSFLSAASFQETTKVLTDAAIKGKIDPLLGLKENVIIGKLIPAGTGMSRYRNINIVVANQEHGDGGEKAAT